MAVGIRLPGTSGNYVSTPDDASLDITGDLCLVAHVALDDWTPASANSLIAKWETGSTSYLFRMDAGATGLLELVTYNGSSNTTKNSTVAPSVSDGADLWVAVTVDVDNGASDALFKFWTSNDGTSWTQLGSTVTNGATIAIASTTANVEVGSYLAGASNLPAGTFYYAAVYNGIGANTAPALGTLVAEFDASKTGTRYRDSTGKIWTVNGSNVTTVITD